MTYFVNETRKSDTASLWPLVKDLHFESLYTVFNVVSSNAEAWSASSKKRLCLVRSGKTELPMYLFNAKAKSLSDADAYKFIITIYNRTRM